MPAPAITVPKVLAWKEKLPADVIPIFEALRETIFEELPNVEESFSIGTTMYKKRVFFGYAWHNKKEGFYFSFLKGRFLPDPDEVLFGEEKATVRKFAMDVPEHAKLPAFRILLHEALAYDDATVSKKKAAKKKA